jgi:HD-GYP domain-containing protein (c-di-GMP phosphodiesterase class II)
MEALLKRAPTPLVPLNPIPSNGAATSTADLAISLLKVVALKDKATHEHSHRVYQLTREWADHMKSRSLWGHMNFTALETAALLHDVGKIGVLDQILLKPDALDPVERQALEQHSEIGYQMVRDFPGLNDVASGIRHHHERYDGRGYPLGIKGTQIPIISRVIAIVDAYDAITSDRPYRKARSMSVAVDVIQKEAGTQFCPELVSSFVQFMMARNG